MKGIYAWEINFYKGVIKSRKLVVNSLMYAKMSSNQDVPLNKMKGIYAWEINTYKGVIRSRKLSLATSEKITATLGNQGFTDYKKIKP